MPKKKSKPQKETIEIRRPERFTEAQWELLTPRQKLVYSTNNGLFKPGETSTVRGKRLNKAAKPLQPVIPLEGITVTMGEGAPPAKSTDITTVEPAFEVHKSDSIAEVVEVNGARLIQDAFARAARAPQKVDPFDMHVYLALLQKMPQLKTGGPAKEETPAEMKRNAKLLREFLDKGTVSEGEFKEVRSG